MRISDIGRKAPGSKHPSLLSLFTIISQEQMPSRMVNWPYWRIWSALLTNPPGVVQSYMIGLTDSFINQGCMQFDECLED